MECDAPLNGSDRIGLATLIIPLCRQALHAGPQSRVPGDGAAVFCSLCPQLPRPRITLSSQQHAASRVRGRTVEEQETRNTLRTNRHTLTTTITTMLICSLARRLTLLLIVEGSFLED